MQGAQHMTDSNQHQEATAAIAMSDRIAVDPNSKFFNQAILEKGVGIIFNGKRRHDVEEFCISEGWITIEHARAKDRFGKPLMVKLKGVVEAFIETNAA
jgi:Protein of unknown function (DUF3297)